MRRARGAAPGTGPRRRPFCSAGTRFRPLSFEVPKPLFPVAGVPMVQHHIEACAKVRGAWAGGGGPGPGLPSPSAPSLVSPQVPGMKEILLMGFYQPHEALSRFLLSAQQEFKIPIRWGTFAPPGFPPWHSPEQPLTHLPRAGSPQPAPRHWAGGLCPTMGGHSRPLTLVLHSFPCPGPCSGSCNSDSPAQLKPPLPPSPVPMST